MPLLTIHKPLESEDDMTSAQVVDTPVNIRIYTHPVDPTDKML